MGCAVARARQSSLAVPQVICIGMLAIGTGGGCRGRAQRELYEAKMAHEIRVLEDQLYEADYHNRVLIDKLEQLRLKSEAASKYRPRDDASYETIPKPVPSREPVSPRDSLSPEPSRDRSADPTPDLVPPDLPDLEGTDLGSPTAPDGSTRRQRQSATPPNLDELGDVGDMVDEGQPVEPSQVTPPTSDSQAAGRGDALPRDETDGRSEPMQAPAAEQDDSGELLPAPGGPEPPSKRDTELPPVLPGEILPPSILDGEEVKPPGQIELPESAQAGVGVPDKIRLHPSLSGGYRIDGEVQDMLVVLTVVDQLGRPLDLAHYQVNGELSIVLFEADQQESEDSRLGRWDFSADQVADLIKSEPISGLHVPILWQGRQPAGEEVMVHVRLRAEEDEMRCEGRLKVQRGNAVAEWAPRGDSLK